MLKPIQVQVVVIVFAITASSIVSLENAQIIDDVRGILNPTPNSSLTTSDSIQKTVQDILVRKMWRPNETLFETETKQLFARFLIDLALEANSTQNQNYLYADQDPDNEDGDVQTELESEVSQTQQFPQNQQFVQQQNQFQQQQQQQINPTQHLQQQPQNQIQQFPQQQINPSQQFNQQQTFQQFPQPQQNQIQQFPQQQQNQNQQFLQQQPNQIQPFPQQQINQQNPQDLQNIPAPITRPPETFAEVDKLIQQIFRLNVTGILDQSLYLTGSNPVRSLLGGVLKLVFCDPISRLLGRCRGNDTLGRHLKQISA